VENIEEVIDDVAIVTEVITVNLDRKSYLDFL